MREWRQAVTVPIPKAGKNLKKVPSYRPIALTSHIAKIAERLVLARLTHLTAERHLLPPEQLGFRKKRSVEDAISRLVKQVQEGWLRKPCPSSQKYKDARRKGGPNVRHGRARPRQGRPPVA